MTSVLFDAPGPRTRTRHRMYTVVFVVLLLAALFWMYRKLEAAGQFEPLIYQYLFSNDVWREFVNGIIGTLKAAAIAIVTSLFAGFFLAVARLSDHAVVRVPATVVVEFFRAVPLLLLIIFLFAFLGPTAVGLTGDSRSLLALVIGLTLYNGSVLAEVFRAGVNAVPRGQSEAAYAIGMRKTQVMTMILTPQAVRFMLPAIISQCVVVLKDTSLGFAALYTPELLASGGVVAELVGNLPTYVFIALLFISMNSLLSALATWLERRLSRSRGGATAVAEVDEVLPAG